MLKFRLLPLLLLFTPTIAFAWNKPGHMVTAAIAYDLLMRDDPKTIEKVVALLQQHPQYADSFAKQLEDVPAESRDRYLFMIASKWPDDVRMNRKYHRGPWHYINYPIVPVAESDQIHPPGPAKENILTALKLNLAIVKDEKALPADKAVALCWVFHLIGDIHQPLHTVSLFSKQYPEGDRGGNQFFVRVKASSGAVDLHSLWDGLILGSTNYQDVSNVAIELRNRKEFAKEELKELAVTEPEKWADESFKIAKEIAYRGGTLQGGSERDGAQVLPEGYSAEAKKIAERRVMLAGYRLSAAMLEIFKLGESAPG